MTWLDEILIISAGVFIGHIFLYIFIHVVSPSLNKLFGVEEKH